MKAHSVVGAVAIFVLGRLVGHVMTLPSSVNAAASPLQISSFELTMKAGSLPVQAANAI